MSYSATGQVWSPETFREFVRESKGDIRAWAKGVTIHHTGAPNLAQRPAGFKAQHLRNLRHFYEKKLRWSAGPHLFTDEDQIFGLSPLSARGVHAKSFNAHYIGIESLGDYDNDDPSSGRGLDVWKTTASAVGILLEELGWGEDAINFHRDDPRTTKSCPGRKVGRDWFLSLVREARSADPEPITTVDLAPSRSEENDLHRELRTRLDHIKWQIRKLEETIDSN